MALLLTEQQIQTYLNDGVLVVENVLSQQELRAALEGLKGTLSRHEVDTEHLASSGCHLRHLSSTNGSGGVLDLFYDDWKIEVATNPKLFGITKKLWRAAYCQESQKTDAGSSSSFLRHPYGTFDCSKGYVYMDRIGYRLPTALAEELGDRLQQDNCCKKKKKGPVPIQRSLTPHLDCCPDMLFSPSNKKWRPIQCFVSLTDSLEPNTGGFEAVKGFHREFEQWAAHRPPTTIVSTSRQRGGQQQQLQQATATVIELPAPCIGEYTHIRPKEDADIMKRVQHVPVSAGSAVFSDNRIPHANSYKHDGATPRAVVYCSFLPDIELNRHYVLNQLRNWKEGRNPTDQWINISNDDEKKNESIEVDVETVLSTPLARRLAGVDPWD